MATLQKKKTNGHYYWYIVESVRVNGKPRPKVLAYLGKPDDLLEKLQGKIPVSSKSYEYGTIAVVNRFIEKLNLIGLFNKDFLKDKLKGIPKRNGLNFGQTLALIIMQRAIYPRSKRAFSKWASKTFLPSMYKFDCKKTDSQHFWDMMDFADEDSVEKLELAITKTIIKEFDIVFDLLLYDYTNFFTFIDTNNSKNTIAQRGKNKQKRNDLRQFCLALMVARDSRIPLFSEIYEGNKSDCKEFEDTIPKVKQRLLDLSKDIDAITIVFDKGSNSKDNFKRLEELNYVASLSPWHDKELREIPYSKFYELKKELSSTDEEEQIIKCYRCEKNIWGKTRTVVMYKSEALFEGQLVGIKKDLKSVKASLEKLRQSGQAGYFLKKSEKRAWTYELFERDIEQTINKTFVKDIIDFKIKKLRNGRFDVSYTVNQKKYNHVKNTVLGKRILITSRNSWEDEEIISAYHGQHDVERNFRKIKNPFHHCVRPQYHWTDQKIIVHTFCSLQSLVISNLIEKTAKDNGFNMTSDEIFDRLQDIRKVKYIYQGNVKGKYTIDYKLEEVSDKTNLDLFNALMA